MAEIVGYNEDAFVAPCVSDKGQTNPRISGGSLNDRASLVQRSAALGVGYHSKRRPVLHGTAGVHELSLAENVAAGGGGKGPQADERRVADHAAQAVVDLRKEVGRRHPRCFGAPGRARAAA